MNDKPKRGRPYQTDGPIMVGYYFDMPPRHLEMLEEMAEYHHCKKAEMARRCVLETYRATFPEKKAG